MDRFLFEESYDDGTIEHDSEPSTEVLETLEGVEYGIS
tara:strand:- start:192 stop:305 length:114 start_codon:yes stop_codon:yes gene_type:complete